jgi:hypothetical protein
MSDKISREDAQAEINGLLVAEICRDFGINFRDVYPEHILARGVGPEQAFIGLAIKRGHLALPVVQPWLSMDTAHKDGRPIAIFIAKDGTVERCVWRTTKENPKGYWWGRSGRCFPGCGEPTCWVPLPQAINTGRETK